MRQVTKAEFFAPIMAGPRHDVQPEIITDRYPYTTEWRFHRRPGRPVYGRIVGHTEEGCVLVQKFYINEEAG